MHIQAVIKRQVSRRPTTQEPIRRRLRCGPFMSLKELKGVQLKELAIGDYLRAGRNIVIDPLGLIYGKTNTPERYVHPKPSVENGLCTLIVLYGVEEIITIELGPVVAGIAVPERVASGADSKLTSYGRRT